MNRYISFRFLSCNYSLVCARKTNRKNNLVYNTLLSSFSTSSRVDVSINAMPKRSDSDHSTTEGDGGIVSTVTTSSNSTPNRNNSPKKSKTVTEPTNISQSSSSSIIHVSTTTSTTTTTKGKNNSVSPHAGPTVYTKGEYEAYSSITDYLPHLSRSTVVVGNNTNTTASLSSSSSSSTSNSTNNPTYRILCYNVNGLRAACKAESVDQFKQYIQTEDPDILILLETKIDQSMVGEFQNLFSFLPYSYFECCSYKKGYAGVAIYSKENFPSTSVTYGFPSSTSTSSSSTENESNGGDGRLLTIRVSSKLTIVGVYVPNSGQKLERLEYRTTVFDPQFRNYLTSLANQSENVIVLGDLNVAYHDMDVHAPKPNRNKTPGFCDGERDNFATLLASGYRDIWRERNPTLQQFTYWSSRFNCRSQNKGWRLDYVLIGGKGAGVLGDKIMDVGVRSKFPGADHVPIFIDLPVDTK